MNLIYFPNKLLYTISSPVVEFDSSLHTFLEDLKKIMLEHKGIGISAIQVGIAKNILLIQNNSAIVEIINPRVHATSDEVVGMAEGCLSAPGDIGVVIRPKSIAISYQDRHGKEVGAVFDNMGARILQHELDHLQGNAFFDFMIREDKRRLKKKYK